MDYKYIGVPTSITYSECCEHDYEFAPSKYSRFFPNDEQLFVPLSSLCKESKNRIPFDKRQMYLYTEIGDIEVSNGTISKKNYLGADMPTKNPKECKKGDILISTVRTYRKGIGYVRDDNNNYCCSPAILIIREVSAPITKEYLLAVLRSDFFKEQILGLQTRGMYPRLDSDAIDKVYIPVPQNESLIRFISVLSIACQNKFYLIKQRHEQILSLIEKELENNQLQNCFNYSLPRINDIIEYSRMDTNLYSYDFKKKIFKILNYKEGYKDIDQLGFKLSRGQNLQISNIGKSIYSRECHPNFYTLVLPKFLSEYGTVNEVNYLGNKNSLKILKKGDLIFGAEGFEKGRSIVVIEEQSKTITNIHGITLQQDVHDLSKAIFVKCFLDYLRDKGLIDLFAVGGNGGSLAQRYWPYIPFPNFPKEKQQEIIDLYHNPQKYDYDTNSFTLDNFLDKDIDYNSKAGIYELDKTARYLQGLLEKAIDSIVKKKGVAIKF